MLGFHEPLVRHAPPNVRRLCSGLRGVRRIVRRRWDTRAESLRGSVPEMRVNVRTDEPYENDGLTICLGRREMSFAARHVRFLCVLECLSKAHGILE